VGASVVARDITSQKQADEALRLSEERFRVALKNAPVVVFSQDVQLRYTWINSAALAWPERTIWAAPMPKSSAVMMARA